MTLTFPDLSASPSASAFKTLYPEFRDAPAEIVERELANAIAALDAEVFGKTLPEAIGLRTAHALATQASGRNARLDPADPDATIYGRRLRALTRTCSAGLGRVARRRP